jgi:hypothetical protein
MRPNEAKLAALLCRHPGRSRDQLLHHVAQMAKVPEMATTLEACLAPPDMSAIGGPSAVLANQWDAEVEAELVANESWPQLRQKFAALRSELHAGSSADSTETDIHDRVEFSLQDSLLGIGGRICGMMLSGGAASRSRPKSTASSAERREALARFLLWLETLG